MFYFKEYKEVYCQSRYTVRVGILAELVYCQSWYTVRVGILAELVYWQSRYTGRVGILSELVYSQSWYTVILGGPSKGCSIIGDIINHLSRQPTNHPLIYCSASSLITH